MLQFSVSLWIYADSCDLWFAPITIYNLCLPMTILKAFKLALSHCHHFLQCFEGELSLVSSAEVTVVYHWLQPNLHHQPQVFTQKPFLTDVESKELSKLVSMSDGVSSSLHPDTEALLCLLCSLGPNTLDRSQRSQLSVPAMDLFGTRHWRTSQCWWKLHSMDKVSYHLSLQTHL